MKSELVFNRYAVALLSLAIEKNKAFEYRSEVKAIKEILKENKEFMNVIGDVNLTIEDKFNIVDKVFNSINEDIKSFIKIIIRNDRTFYLYDIFKETLYRFDDYLHIEEGVIICSKNLLDEDIEKAIKAIEKKTNKKLELTKVIDESLIGGFIIKVKDNVYDASIKSKLAKLKENLNI